MVNFDELSAKEVSEKVGGWRSLSPDPLQRGDERESILVGEFPPPAKPDRSWRVIEELDLGEGLGPQRTDMGGSRWLWRAKRLARAILHRRKSHYLPGRVYVVRTKTSKDTIYSNPLPKPKKR